MRYPGTPLLRRYFTPAIECRVSEMFLSFFPLFLPLSLSLRLFVITAESGKPAIKLDNTDGDLRGEGLRD